MKLEVRHLTAYIPYGLKIYDPEPDKNGADKYLDVDNIGRYVFYPLGLPILNPLWEAQILIEDCFDNPTKENEAIRNLFCVEHIHQSYDLMEYSDLEWLPYDSFHWLLKNNYDVFKLIENGFAVDINSIDNVSV